MPQELHPASTPHLPFFTPLPDGSDFLLNVTAVTLTASVLAVGILFFRIHTLPERMAHKSKKIQVELIAVLGLLSLLSHEHLFWVAGLLLAFIDLPDIGAPFQRAVRALEALAKIDPPQEEARDEPQAAPQEKQNA